MGRHQRRSSDDAGKTLPFAIGVVPTEAAARRYLHDRLATHEFWVLPVVSRNALRVVEVVEARFFPGSTPGFEAMILSEATMGVCAVALASKRVLPAGRLNVLMRQLGGPPGCEAGGDQDVIAVLDPLEGGARDRSIARTLAFAGWLAGGGAS